MTKNTETVSGSCLCGRVTFEVEEPVKWCGHCHCDLCRRAHGSPFVTWFGVAREHFHLRGGEDELKWYHSSEAAKRGFCSVCGSTMFFSSSRWADEMHIALPFMHSDISKAPSAHVYWDRQVHWVKVHDDLKKLGGSTGVEALDLG